MFIADQRENHYIRCCLLVGGGLAIFICQVPSFESRFSAAYLPIYARQ